VDHNSRLFDDWHWLRSRRLFNLRSRLIPYFFLLFRSFVVTFFTWFLEYEFLATD
jgi:hypothetical protein